MLLLACRIKDIVARQWRIWRTRATRHVTLSEERKKGWRMNCDVGKATEGLENELWRRWSDGKVAEWAETISRAHSPTFPSLHLCHSSFSNPSVASPTSQFILQPLFRFSYVTGSSLNVTWRAAHVGGFAPSRQRIIAVCATVTPDMLAIIWRELEYRLDSVMLQEVHEKKFISGHPKFWKSHCHLP